MTAEQAIQELCDSLIRASEALRQEARECPGETAEILIRAANTATTQSAHWMMFTELNFGRVKNHG